jgi:hypothetical protein
LYEAVPHYSNNRLGDDLSGIGFDNEDNSFKEQVDDYADGLLFTKRFNS